MKVVEINAVYGEKSTGLIVRDIGQMLMGHGDKVRYVYQFGDCDPSINYRVGSPLDWKAHALYTRLIGRQGWASRTATRKLLSYLDTEKPDLVHLHNLHANYINLPMLLTYLAKNDIATVVTLHDCWFFTGKCCHFISSGCERWKNGCGKCPKRSEAPKSLIFDSSSQVAKAKAQLFAAIPNLTVVGCSKWIADLAKESYVFNGCRVEQIYNGVDTDVFAPLDRQECKKKLGITAEYVMMGMAGKWFLEENKDVFDAVVQSLKDYERLLLVGCTDDQKSVLSANPKIIPVGYIKDRALLACYYNSADAFANLTFEDTLPTVNMEAICCGTPVITYDSCGSPELVSEGKTGWIIPQKDRQMLLSAWDMIKHGKIDRQNCRKIGEQQFNKESRYSEYVSLFQNMTNGRDE